MNDTQNRKWPGLVAAVMAAMTLHALPAMAIDDVGIAILANQNLDGDARALKRGRLVPSGNSANLPVLVSPVDEEKMPNAESDDKAPGDGAGPSTGTALFDRMGAPLPELPAEKPFTGKVDEAFGAFQRGYYLTAMSKALPKAQLGDPAAQTLVAELLASGLGVKQNVKDAVFWYEQAARGGDPNAAYKYALILMEGNLVARDKAKADEMMRKAAEGGNANAQFNVAQILVAASPGEKGLRDALPFYEKAADQGIPDAQYALSQIYMNIDVPKAKKDSARMWLEKAAKAGFDTALYDMGVWLVNGTGGAQDLEGGFEWMKRAANRGHVLAQNKLAHLYINAIGTRPDPVEAAKWYVLSRRAGLKDLDLEDFYLGINEEQQKAGISAANKFRPS